MYLALARLLKIAQHLTQTARRNLESERAPGRCGECDGCRCGGAGGLQETVVHDRPSRADLRIAFGEVQPVRRSFVELDTDAGRDHDAAGKLQVGGEGAGLIAADDPKENAFLPFRIDDFEHADA